MELCDKCFRIPYSCGAVRGAFGGFSALGSWAPALPA